MTGRNCKQLGRGRFPHNLECALNLWSLEPFAVLAGERPLRGQLKARAVAPRLLCSNTLLNFKTLQLKGGGAGQIDLPYLVAANSFGGSYLRGKTLDVEADHFFCVDDLSLLQRVEIGNDNRVQPVAGTVTWTAFEPDDRNFLDEW